uniref:Uncharacterized protein n=1 Tax=Romanomermis culicivorax TaxID=13658 RepID=A0A915J1X4_ROMCU
MIYYYLCKDVARHSLRKKVFLVEQGLFYFYTYFIFILLFIFILISNFAKCCFFPPNFSSASLFSENCELIKCPVDCNVTVGGGGAVDQCPACNCPLGQRCRPLQCPGCKITQKLDGCLHCSCSFTTYEFFDENRRMDVFSTNALDSTGSKETCNLQDAQSIEKCMTEMLNYMKLAELKNPALIAQPLYSMFLYDTVQIGEICGHFDRALRCVSPDILTRCQNKERHLNMINSMFRFICNDLSSNLQETNLNFKRYECIRNILVSHRIVDYCSTILSRKVDKAAVSSSLSFLEKRTTKCRALNDFTSCVRPILYTYCDRQAGDFFAGGLSEARDTVAPECRRTLDGSFEPFTDDFSQSDVL